MNRLSTEKRAQIIGCLVEGNSIRATVRMTGAAKNTITKLLVDLGEACSEYQDVTLRNLPCKFVECDEIWAYCYSKQRNIPEEHQGTFGYGDVWTWTALCADTKLVPSWLIGERTKYDAIAFMKDLEGRLAGRVQLTTDGHKAYWTGIGISFGWEIDYAELHKIYGPDGNKDGQKRYSPSKLSGTKKKVVSGTPTCRASRPATSSARTSRCAWACAASRG